MTLFPIFDIPVFWPILLLYWLVLLFITMRRQIRHMIKYRYIPFSTGKKVCGVESKRLRDLMQPCEANNTAWTACAALYRLRVIQAICQIGLAPWVLTVVLTADNKPCNKAEFQILIGPASSAVCTSADQVASYCMHAGEIQSNLVFWPNFQHVFVLSILSRPQREVLLTNSA